MKSEVRTVLQRAESLVSQDKLHDALKLLRDADQTIQKAEQTKALVILRANILSSLAVIEKKLAKNEQVLNTLRHLLKLIILNGLGVVEQAVTLINIGTILFHLQKTDLSLSYTMRALKMLQRSQSATKVEDPPSQTTAHPPNHSSNLKQKLVNQVLACFNLAVYHSDLGNALEATRSLNSAKSLAIKKFGFKQKVTELVTRNIEAKPKELKPFFLAQKFVQPEEMFLEQRLSPKKPHSDKSDVWIPIASEQIGVPLPPLSKKFSHHSQSENKRTTLGNANSDFDSIESKRTQPHAVSNRIISADRESQKFKALPKLSNRFNLHEKSNQLLGIRIDKHPQPKPDLPEPNVLLTESEDAQSAQPAKPSKANKSVQTAESGFSKSSHREPIQKVNNKLVEVSRPPPKKAKSIQGTTHADKPSRHRHAELMEMLTAKKPPKQPEIGLPSDKPNTRETQSLQNEKPVTAKRSSLELLFEKKYLSKTKGASLETATTADESMSQKKKLEIDRLHITLRYMG